MVSSSVVFLSGFFLTEEPKTEGGNDNQEIATEVSREGFHESWSLV